MPVYERSSCIRRRKELKTNLKNLEQSLEERTQRVGSLTTMEERDARLRSLERTLKNDKNGWRYESGGKKAYRGIIGGLVLPAPALDSAARH